jgi:hypothetical protein
MTDGKPVVFGIDLASGEDLLMIHYAGVGMTPAEFVAHLRGRFTDGALSYEVDATVLHMLLDLAEISARPRRAVI